MEQEGIYYYFRHEDGKHTLVLSDSVGSHDPLFGYEQIPYFPPDEHFRRERDHIYDWSISQEVQPGIYTLNDFDFKRPKANLEAKSSMPRNHARAGMEIYDYPGEYTYTEEGEAYARARLEEFQAEFEQGHGQASARGLAVGNLFSLTDYPRQDQNREYLVIAADSNVVLDTYGSTARAEGEELYTCGFMAVDSKQPYRPARITPKPLVQGPQTAVVVGPSGDEIYTDQYGRVKVRFHWDREPGKADEERSCWIRVAQVWAGSRWGSIHIPRVGQEVVIEFLEGDPDRPIIMGQVYNNDNMPPYDLPVQRTQSGIKSRSSKQGNPSTFNELRFEDKKGEEEIFLHAQKDQNSVVNNNMSTSVGVDQSLTVANNRTKTVKNDEVTSVEGHRTERVDKTENHSVGADMMETVEGNHHLTIKADHKGKIGGNKHTQVSRNQNEKIDGTLSLQAGKIQEKVDGNYALDAAQEIHLKAGQSLVIEAGMELTLKVGNSFIKLDASGVAIFGTPMAMLNSGGSPGQGRGSNPTAPEAPTEASKPSMESS
jgi:type VI secretion system secreted protein VgrG